MIYEPDCGKTATGIRIFSVCSAEVLLVLLSRADFTKKEYMSTSSKFLMSCMQGSVNACMHK